MRVALRETEGLFRLPLAMEVFGFDHPIPRNIFGTQSGHNRLSDPGQYLTRIGDNIRHAHRHKGKANPEMWIICGQTLIGWKFRG